MKPASAVWSEIDNLIPRATLYALWAPRDDLAIGVGPRGAIWQWDGLRWQQRVSPTSENLFSIAGSTLGTVVAIGNGGTALQQVGGSFVPRNTHTLEDLRGAWRSDSGTFVAVGTRGVILRGDGSAWSSDDSPTRSSLFSVWGSDDNHIFAVGVGGVILYNAGFAWSEMHSGTTEILSSVNGTASDDVYAVGAAGTILHYDGTSWMPMTSHSTELMQSVCAGCGPVAVGTNGTVVQWVGGAWTRNQLTGRPWLYATATTGNRIWAVGAHALFASDGDTWEAVTQGTIPVLRAVASSPSHDLVTVGDNGAVMLGGPDQWRFEDAGALARLNTVWTSSSDEILAAGTNRIFRRTDGGWVSENDDIVEYFDINGDNNVVFAVGTDGNIRERHGTSWSIVATPTTEDLHAVVMTPTGGYMVGDRANILHREGSAWSLKYQSPGRVLWDVIPIETGVWRAVAVGGGGLSMALPREQGSAWTPIPTPVTSTLYSLARGPGNAMYAVGVSGGVIRLINAQWEVAPSPASRTLLNALDRNGELFVCGGTLSSGGALFRYSPQSP